MAIKIPTPQQISKNYSAGNFALQTKPVAPVAGPPSPRTLAPFVGPVPRTLVGPPAPTSSGRISGASITSSAPPAAPRSTGAVRGGPLTPTTLTPQTAPSGLVLGNPNQPTFGEPFDTLYNQLQDYLEQLRQRGQVINPNVEITPDKVSEFVQQASSEITPYYASQLKVATDQFLQSIGYSQDQLLAKEKDLQQRYSEAVRNLGANEAEVGFAQSGRRALAEQQLADTTQQQLTNQRQELQFNLGKSIGSFAEKYGTANVPQDQLPPLPDTPQALPGQANFQSQAQNRNLYQLSPSVYDGLKGTQQYQEQSDLQQRQAQLEQAYRGNQQINQQRQLNL